MSLIAEAELEARQPRRQVTGLRGSRYRAKWKVLCAIVDCVVLKPRPKVLLYV
jgi:hypothetical protein